MRGEGRRRGSRPHGRETQAPGDRLGMPGVEGRQARDAVVAQYRDGAHDAEGR